MNLQVCDRTRLTELAEQPFTDKTAVISICDSDAPAVELKYQPDYLLRLVFDDVYTLPDFGADNKMGFVSFSKEQAEDIAKFVLQHKDEVTTIICQCEMGQSRRAAVAAAISEWLNGDGIRFFADERYSPSLVVFKTLYNLI